MTDRLPEHPQLRLIVTDAGGRAVLAVAGELDVSTAATLDAALREQLARGPLQLDLRELSFMDSSGVLLLDGLLRDGAREGWDLTIDPRMQRAVTRVFELTGMMSELPLADPPPREEDP